MRDKEIFNPGIYEISNERYHSSAGISRSGIMEFRKSPAHYYHRYLNPNYIPKPSSPEMDFGSAFHCYMLEPQKFDDEYVIKPEKREKLPEVPLLKDSDRKTYDSAKIAYEVERKRRQQEDASFYDFALGKIIINRSDMDVIFDMGEALEKDTRAIELIRGAKYEKSIYWIDEDSGLLCKSRPDIMFDNFIVDLKTTRDASFRAFSRDFFSMGYHLQMAMLSEATASLGHRINNFIDLAIEKESPYHHAIFPIDESVIEFGIEQFKKHY